VKKILLVILVFSFIGLNAQQQQHFTHFMYNKLYLNPGYAGDQDYTSLSVLYRDQWSGLAGAPEAQVFSANFGGFENIGFGMVIDRQTIGIQESVSVGGMYAYKLIINDMTISAGLSGSFRRFSEDFTDPSLIAIQGLSSDPAIPQEIFNKNIINAGVGFYLKTNNFFLGASSPRLIKAQLEEDNNNFLSEEVRHFYLMGGMTFYINDKLTFTPQALVKLAENSPFDLDLNFGVTMDEKYTVGLNYRYGGNDGGLGESIDLMFNFQLNESLLFGIAQDFTLSDISNYESGSLEAFVRYAFIKKKPKTVMINPRYF
jgi:type IX secretion system PorP/SprF family membrane protein